MSTILVLSPHLDDAAFSVGPLLAEINKKLKIVVCTAFTKTENNLSDFALACQLDKGLSDDVDYMAIRRKEDIDWSKLIGVEINHGLLAEAPHRRYNSAKSLFGPIHTNDDIEIFLTIWLNELISTFNPTLILCPLAVGNHVDHIWIKNVIIKNGDLEIPVFFYKDQPYSSTLIDFNEIDYFSDGIEIHKLHVPISETAVNIALNAAKAYVSQTQFQFGGCYQMDKTLKHAWKNLIPLYSLHNPTEFKKATFSFLGK